MKYLVALMCCAICFCRPVYAEMQVVPLPTKPVHVPTIPASVVPTAICVGVSDDGVVACTAMWKWCGGGRFCTNYQVELAYAYDTITSVISVLPAAAGDKYTRALKATSGGRICGQSSNGRSTYSIVAWQSGLTTNYGSGTLTDCDDLGRVAKDNQIYDGAWSSVAGVMAVLALSNNGDYVAAYLTGDHVELWRASQRVIEDGCVSPCMADLIQLPPRTLINSTGTAAWHYSFATQPPLGFVDRAGTAIAVSGAPWAGINAQGDVVGGNKVLHADNSIVEIVPSCGFTTVSALGINASGVIVGVGRYGTIQRGFVWAQ